MLYIVKKNRLHWVKDVVTQEDTSVVLQGIDRLVFKVRLKNSNIQKGNAGYRVIYYLQTRSVVLIAIYSESDLSDVSDRTIEQAIRQYEK